MNKLTYIQKIKNIDFTKWGLRILSVVFAVAPFTGMAALPGQDSYCGRLNGLRCESGSFGDFLVSIINILLGVAFLIAVLFLIVGGFRYIFSAGNEDAAKLGKATVINALIGIAIIILSYVMVSVISNIASNRGGTGL